ncbi:hypothetical protein LZ31DRAFT_579260 [Colletotrichum somersetense]|nr:hypothetical protein LZ31DRAFT_579260 [Colletotrichum somersetense]
MCTAPQAMSKATLASFIPWFISMIDFVDSITSVMPDTVQHSRPINNGKTCHHRDLDSSSVKSLLRSMYIHNNKRQPVTDHAIAAKPSNVDIRSPCSPYPGSAKRCSVEQISLVDCGANTSLDAKNKFAKALLAMTYIRIAIVKLMATKRGRRTCARADSFGADGMTVKFERQDAMVSHHSNSTTWGSALYPYGFVIVKLFCWSPSKPSNERQPKANACQPGAMYSSCLHTYLIYERI